MSMFLRETFLKESFPSSSLQRTLKRVWHGRSDEGYIHHIKAPCHTPVLKFLKGARGGASFKKSPSNILTLSRFLGQKLVVVIENVSFGGVKCVKIVLQNIIIYDKISV